MTANVTAILHLSDLHLGKSYDDIGAKGGEVWRTIRNFWSRGDYVMQAHDPFIVSSLRTNVRMAARQLGLADDSFDLMVVTGDISTTANSDMRFKFAKEFLTGSCKDGNNEIGLQFPCSSVLCVPGNHDKMHEQTCDRYLASFSDLPSSLPYSVEKRCNGMRFTFYGIDSNLYEEGNVAKGHITTGTLAWLSEQKYVAQKDKADPKSLRILLLHHHPCDLNKFREGTSKNFLTRRMDRLSRLNEGERVLDLCHDWIDVIMHGHEHFPITFRDDTSGAVVVSAGTASQFHSEMRRNSFFALVFKDRMLTVREFVWQRGRFQQEDYDKSYSLPRKSGSR